MLILGGILLAIACICGLILYIISLMKTFKSGETIWGVLTIFFSPLVPVIWGFMNNDKKLSINWIIVTILGIVGYAILVFGLISQAQNMPEIQEALQNATQPQ